MSASLPPRIVTGSLPAKLPHASLTSVAVARVNVCEAMPEPPSVWLIFASATVPSVS